MNKTLINNNLYYCKKWWRTTETKMIQKGWRDHWSLWNDDYFERYKFFETLEYCLNFAIDCCAAAIDGVIDTVGEYQCKDLNTASESSKKVAGKLLGMIGLGMLMQIMSFLGSYAAVFAGVTIIKN